jgi:hypothetical protein
VGKSRPEHLKKGMVDLFSEIELARFINTVKTIKIL